MTLNEQDNGRAIELNAGDVLNLNLKENPSTGYKWVIESGGELELISDNYQGGEALGAGGVHEFQFRAPGHGSHELRLKNLREWEGDSSITERFNATIVIR